MVKKMDYSVTVSFDTENAKADVKKVEEYFKTHDVRGANVEVDTYTNRRGYEFVHITFTGEVPVEIIPGAKRTWDYPGHDGEINIPFSDEDFIRAVEEAGFEGCDLYDSDFPTEDSVIEDETYDDDDRAYDAWKDGV